MYKSRTSTLSFNSSGRPIPSEHRLREIFERYFSPNGTSTTKERRKSIHHGKKIVDLVLEDSRSLKNRLGSNDKVKLDEYLSSLNQVEQQLNRNEKWLEVPMKDFDSRAGFSFCMAGLWALVPGAAPGGPANFIFGKHDHVCFWDGQRRRR